MRGSIDNWLDEDDLRLDSSSTLSTSSISRTQGFGAYCSARMIGPWTKKSSVTSEESWLRIQAYVFPSIDDLRQKFECTKYIVDPVPISQVYVTGELRKPVLIEGPPGCGKTELASPTNSAPIGKPSDSGCIGPGIRDGHIVGAASVLSGHQRGEGHWQVRHVASETFPRNTDGSNIWLAASRSLPL